MRDIEYSPRGPLISRNASKGNVTGMKTMGNSVEGKGSLPVQAQEFHG